ncbi:MAG TPA: sulfite exporter TauE/SafE family protein [Bryobacteraceae bacterium]|nr:sulfite exporter TauE/SafE family protein [Bryobacteraceae bacterium]
MTTPLLIILLGVPPATAVGTALTFGAIVKVASIPSYAVRKQVNLKVLGWLVAGGIPGVLVGSVALDNLKHGHYQGILFGALGCLIVGISLLHLYRIFRPGPRRPHVDRSRWLPWLAFPIGGEVGFSSAGAGALGSLLLLGMTPLTAAEVVGTDLCFGLVLSGIGGFIQIVSGNYNGPLLLKLVIGGLCGAFTGSMLAGKIAQRPLRVALLLALIVLGCQLALRA